MRQFNFTIKSKGGGGNWSPNPRLGMPNLHLGTKLIISIREILGNLRLITISSGSITLA